MDCARVFCTQPQNMLYAISDYLLRWICKDGVTRMCGCNCIIRHTVLYFSTYCPLLGIIVLLVKVIFKCRHVFILPPNIQEGRLVRSPLPFLLKYLASLIQPAMPKDVNVSIYWGFHTIRWDCCMQDAVESTAEAPTEGQWHSLTFPWDGLPCAHQPVWWPDCCPRENLLVVLVIACYLSPTILTELQSHFIFPENVKWRGLLSATSPCFIAEMRDEQLYSPLLLPRG